MNVADGELVPTFVAEDSAWVGAIFEMRRDTGPVLVARCGHVHPTMRQATACSTAELAFARRVVELSELHRDIEP
jgi:hypothetical protein